jgi:hypothetical protein
MNPDNQNETPAIMVYIMRIYNDVLLEDLNMEVCKYYGMLI